MTEEEAMLRLHNLRIKAEYLKIGFNNKDDKEKIEEYRKELLKTKEEMKETRKIIAKIRVEKQKNKGGIKK